MILLTGSRQTADEGLAAWLLMRLSGLSFEHRFGEESQGDFAELVVDGEAILTSSGIAAFIGDLVPQIWPEDSRQRAHARSVAAEAFGQMHDLKSFMPMAITEQYAPAARLLKRTARDVNRMISRWEQFLTQKTSPGPFLFGEFSAADAFHAPLAARCVTYGLTVNEICESYVDAVMSYPAVAEWQSLAGQSDRNRKIFEGVALDDAIAVPPAALPVPQEEPIAQAVPGPQVEQRIEPTAKSVESASPVPEPTPKEAAQEPLPFAVDLKPQIHGDQDKSEPVLIRPREGGLFSRRKKRPGGLFRPIDAPNKADALAEAEPERPARQAGIKPIGGEIRRRR